MQNEKEYKLIDNLYASYADTPKLSNEVITGHDSIKALLASQTQIGMAKYPWSEMESKHSKARHCEDELRSNLSVIGLLHYVRNDGLEISF